MIIIDLIQVYQKITDDISLLVENKFKTIKRDRTFKAKVTEKTAIDKYKILYQNNHYTVRSDTELRVGDIIYVCAPENNWSELFVISTAKNESKSVVDIVYPIGSIYLSVSAVNPSRVLGGTWVTWGSGRVPVGVNTADGNYNSVEKTGGSANHTHNAATSGSTSLSTAQIPSHAHSVSITSGSSGSHTHNLYREFGAAAVAEYTPHNENYMQLAGNKAGTRHAGSSSVAANGGHAHTINGNTGANGSGSGHTHSIPAASGSNLPPYITCYMWKRTQ